MEDVYKQSVFFSNDGVAGAFIVPVDLPHPKVCTCCFKIHTETTGQSRIGRDCGYLYFECTCGSTLMVKLDGVTIKQPGKRDNILWLNDRRPN